MEDLILLFFCNSKLFSLMDDSIVFSFDNLVFPISLFSSDIIFISLFVICSLLLSFVILFDSRF